MKRRGEKAAITTEKLWKGHGDIENCAGSKRVKFRTRRRIIATNVSEWKWRRLSLAKQNVIWGVSLQS